MLEAEEVEGVDRAALARCVRELCALVESLASPSSREALAVLGESPQLAVTLAEQAVAAQPGFAVRSHRECADSAILQACYVVAAPYAVSAFRVAEYVKGARGTSQSVIAEIVRRHFPSPPALAERLERRDVGDGAGAVVDASE